MFEFTTENTEIAEIEFGGLPKLKIIKFSLCALRTLW
jgi:hypothetical protein